MFKLGPNKAIIEVTVLPDQNPNYKFDAPANIWDGQTFTFNNGGHNGFFLYFVIKTPEYYFANNMNAAICAKKIVTPQDRCPGPLPANQYPWDQFKPFDLSGDFKTLTVHDPNGKGQECQFGFTLFVTTNSDGSPGPSGQYLALDPIGQNNNGPVQMNWLAVGATVGAAVAAAAVALSVAGVFES